MTKYVGGGTSYVNMIAATSFSGFRFVLPPVLMQGLPFAFSELEQFALRLRDTTTADGKRVCVFSRGGSFDADSCSTGPHNSHGNTAIYVFTSNEPVTITGTKNGKPFSGSVIAPFARVTVEPSVQYVGGFIIAESYDTGKNAQGMQIHGYSFTGDLRCGTDAPSCASLLAGRQNAKAVYNTMCLQLDDTDVPGGCSAFYAQHPNGDIDFCRKDLLTTKCIVGTDATNDVEGLNCAAGLANGSPSVVGAGPTGTCKNLWTTKKCSRKKQKGKCSKKRPKANCAFTCGTCGPAGR